MDLYLRLLVLWICITNCLGTNAIVRGKLIDSGLTIGEEYSISFTFTARKFSPGWHNILHFTTGEDLGKPGSRIPAVWMHMSLGNENAKPLFICSDVNGNSNYCWTSSPIPINTPTQIQIRQWKPPRSDPYYQIRINGKQQHAVYIKSHAVHHNVSLYASDPWYPAQEGEIKDLEYPGVNRPRPTKVTTPRPTEATTPRPTEGTNTILSVRGKLIDSGLTIGKEYRVSFTFTAKKFSPGWHSILHFTTGDDIGKPGSRIPAVWMHNTKGNENAKPLFICSDVDATIAANTHCWQTLCCWTSQPIPINTPTQIQIRQTSERLAYTYQILIDGKLWVEQLNNNARVFHNVSLYASDPWYPAQDGEIRNLEYPEVGIQIVRSKLIETGMTIGKEYSVSFKLFPNEFSPGWHNVLHFNALTPYGKAGSRVPAIWMHDTLGNEETKPLYICADVNNNVDYCFTTKPIRRLRWTQIEVKQFKSSVGYTYQILIDGSKEHEVNNKHPRVFHGVRLQVSNTKDKPQSGEIKDLEYSGAKKGINIELIGGRHGVAVELYDVEEGVKLYNKTTLFYTISKKFSFPETDGVRLYFDKRDETNFTNNEEVIVKNSELYYFTYLDEPGWNCHLGLEGNPRCISLQGGQLFWKGTYIVRKRYPSFQKEDITTTPSIPKTTVPCVNLGRRCEYWAKIGECEKNPKWMIQYCRKACKKCH